jgi:hypothetical protein
MKKFVLIIVAAVFFKQFLFGQSVVVNQYFNAADPRDEWTELIVVTDNTDMRSWTLRDNNSSQTSWQTAITFKNVSFWNNMRSGTIIIIRHRVVNSSGVTYSEDSNKNDGYIELSAQNTTYFSGGDFGTSPSWAGNSLNIAGAGEVEQLRDASNTHVHALGHLATAGADWIALPTPKLNHANNAASGDAIYACPARYISNYNGPATGNNYTAKNNSTLTFGLPNTCGSSATGNTVFIDSLREPEMTMQVITPTVFSNYINLSWSAATDPNPSDGTVGYIILRNTVNSFVAPSDGTTYVDGATIGSATVVAHINSSAITSYDDYAIAVATTYYYRIYAYRYTTDNVNGNSYNQSRGRAYNQTNYVYNSIGALPIELVNFNVLEINKEVDISWTTLTEINNDYFTIERSADAILFLPIEIVDGAGNSTDKKNYFAKDHKPLNGISYYRLKQTDYNGAYSYSPVRQVRVNNDDIIIQNIYPNPTNNNLNIVLINSGIKYLTYTVVNVLGETVKMFESSDSFVSFYVDSLPEGVYIINVKGEEFIYQSKFIKMN